MGDGPTLIADENHLRESTLGSGVQDRLRALTRDAEGGAHGRRDQRDNQLP